MKCAVVLMVRDFAELDEAYAFDYTFQSLVNCGISELYYVLIAEGFRNIPRSFVRRWRTEGIHILDCAPVVQSLLADYPLLQALSAKRVFKVTFLRHLILERFFGGEAVLSVDADVVWRVDPYQLFGQWDGGFIAWSTSGFLTYARSPDWFRAYRAGLESVISGGELTSDFKQAKFGVTRILHDQHLIQHLVAKGVMMNEWQTCWSTPAFRGLCVMANPLAPKSGFRMPPERIIFRREGRAEYFNEAFVPFWHMQTGFSNLCSFFFIAAALNAAKDGRLPFPLAKSGEDNLKTALLHRIRDLIVENKTSERRLKEIRPLMFRRGVYKEFFEGALAERLFTDPVWWEPGVFN